MLGFLDSAGERLLFDSQLPWVSELIVEGAGGAPLQRVAAEQASVVIAIETSRQPFNRTHWRLLTRDAYERDGEVVVENACTSGFDLHLRCIAGRAAFTYRWRPPARDRAAARALRSRFHLLARSVLMQYPALWWSGTYGRAPLHASACLAEGARPLIVSAGGVGRSTLMLELAADGAITGDNLAVGDGSTVWGLVEPLRAAGGSGRRMPHGRAEIPLPNRLPSVAPDRVVILERATKSQAGLGLSDPVHAARSLVASTYMAGELRRYWALAATLAAGTGIGPPHPPVAEIAAAFTARLPCLVFRLGTGKDLPLSVLFGREEANAWAS